MRYLVFFALVFSSISIQAEVRCEDLFPSDRKKFSLPSDEETLLLKGPSSDRRLQARERFNVLVWNIHKAKDKRFWPDFRKLHGMAQLSLVQEAILNPEQCSIYRSMGETEWATSISFWQKPHTATGVTTGSKYFAKEYDFIRSPDREPVINTPKMATYSKYPINGALSELVVVNLHGINVTPTETLANQLNGIADRIGNHLGPLIVAGDYNTKNKSRFQVMYDFAEKMGLEVLDLKNDNRKKKLDHILARGLKVHRAEILPDIITSDHPALWAEFEVE